MSKKQRQQALLEIIEQNSCCRQEDMQLELEKRGIITTQATISRDIRQMGLIKVQQGEGYTYVQRQQSEHKTKDNPYTEIFAHAVLDIDYAMNTVVIKCRTGMANAACAALDSMEFSEIVGTLAGDDTIFILMRTEAEAKSISQELSELGL